MEGSLSDPAMKRQQKLDRQINLWNATPAIPSPRCAIQFAQHIGQFHSRRNWVTHLIGRCGHAEIAGSVGAASSAGGTAAVGSDDVGVTGIVGELGPADAPGAVGIATAPGVADRFSVAS
jgi:hypothetical protein